ncbi:polyketide cyclase [Maricaulis sp. W15]|uniref:SRPBCC family protein n=1 Tax=Maricaulis sp. W15 TaxID=1772333 RepID=UPI000948B114|nr:SRPBCC family protein [Maricaulis sp. W15]OLF77829.1 polyketide cyclase [Maricaulis sp. W15]
MTRNRDWAEFNPETDLTIERRIDAPVELVWSAWTDPERLKQWWCPQPWSTPEVEMDLRPGGIFRTVMQSPEGDRHDNAGIFLAIEPRAWIAWTSALRPGFRPAPDAGDSGLHMTAGIEFKPDGTGTHYSATVLHPDAASRKRHEAMGFHDGWGTVIDQLAAHVATMKAGAQ